MSERVLPGREPPDPGRKQLMCFGFRLLDGWDLVHSLGLPEGSEVSRWFLCAHQEALPDGARVVGLNGTHQP